ncbi:NAD(P)/FAD-dependent oxidoreductase [Terrihabitans rhizophilus]|uniref:FAD-dependent oxidoreductase n=1 Tax=Terrihabitans rhizophilus TaxID=3092662 RepID=A0ABU4RKS7_9HYPH|nr:FAD-dependent oxidoreductase [Terrihabitans sp. PJ23]MDX6804813.1 FAD-dependent oxidoreductase [Terrihabitans sp. PJ23]
MNEHRCDVLIVGAGPAGLGAAARLRERGVSRVLVVDREAEAGGVPRHCHHSPFGMREFGRILTGRGYARRLAERAIVAGAEIRLRTSVVSIDRDEDLSVLVTGDDGPALIRAFRIMLATGGREMPRAARLISGERPLGVINTGALQAMPPQLAAFRRPLILGTELVALSALLTCRGRGMRPVMMVEETPYPLVRPAFMALPRLLGVPVRYGARVLDIRGRPRVEAVTLGFPDGSAEDIACDGVVFAGRFTPESALARIAGLDVDAGTGGPVIDQFGRCSDPRIFAAGNVLRPVETAGWCWAEGGQIAGFMAQELAGGLPPPGREVAVHRGAGVAYAVPQRLVPGEGGLDSLQLRVERPVRGLSVAAGSTILARVGGTAMPARRIALPLPSGVTESLTVQTGPSA